MQHKALGKLHPKMIVSMTNLAALMREQGDLKEEKKMKEKIRRLKRQDKAKKK